MRVKKATYGVNRKIIDPMYLTKDCVIKFIDPVYKGKYPDLKFLYKREIIGKIIDYSCNKKTGVVFFQIEIYESNDINLKEDDIIWKPKKSVIRDCTIIESPSNRLDLVKGMKNVINPIQNKIYRKRIKRMKL